MGFRTVIVNEHSKLSYKNNHLIYKSAVATEMIHLSEIDVLILETTDIVITNMLISRLMDENILVIFCDKKRLPKAQLIPFYGRHDSSLQLQKQIGWSDEAKAKVWTAIIAQKITNQSQFLAEHHFDEKAVSLENLLSGLELLDPSNREGHAARIYFNTLYGNDFTRDLSTSVNAGLDYGYTLLMSVFAREIVKNGCMTQLGLKHSNQFNDFNLASDIMEPFRPLVDEIVYAQRAKEFPIIKRQLFELFTQTYSYRGSEMYLTNIAADYCKRVIACLHGEKAEIPQFVFKKSKD